MLELIHKLSHRKVTVLMLVLGMVGFGIASYHELSFELMPKKETSILSIITRYPGNAPSRIEELITKPIENQIVGIGGIEKILSSSEEGESKITIFFQDKEVLKYKAVEIKSKVDMIRDKFPREVEEPYVVRFNPDDRPMFIIKLASSGEDLKSLRELAEKKYKTILEKIPGVGEVLVIGGRYREVRIDLNKGKMLGARVNPNAVMESIRNINRDSYLGKVINEQNQDVEVRIKNRIHTISELKDIMIPVGESSILVKLEQIADIYDGARDLEDLSREKGEENVTIQIKRNSQANIIDTCAGLRKQVDSLGLPPGAWEIAYDQSQYISSAISSVVQSALIGAVACCAVIFLFLRNSIYTIIICITIPIAILISFCILHFFGTTLNVMTLAGLALGIGVLIDSSIVMIERINENLKTDPGNAISKSIGDLWKELFASSITNIIVFVPLLFASKELRSNFQDLAISVSACIIISYFLSVLFVPTIARSLLSYKKEDIDLTFVWERFWRKDYTKFLEISKEKSKQIFSLLNRYTKVNWLRFQILICLLGIVCVIQIRKEYIDFQGGKELQASVELKTGTNLEITSQIVSQVEKLISEQPFVEKVSTKVEKWHADLIVKIDVSKTNDKLETIKEKLNEITSHLEGVFVYYADVNSFGNSKELDIDIIGDETSELKKIAGELAKEIQSIPETDQVVYRFREGKKEYQVNLNREKIVLAGLNTRDITEFARTAIQGSIPTKFFDKDKEVDIRVRFRNNDRKEIDDLMFSLLPVEKKSVSLKEMGFVKLGEADTRINRKNKRRMVTITSTFKNVGLSEYADLVEKRLETVSFPLNYFYEFGESIKKIRKNQIEMIGFILFAIFLTYSVLSILFQSMLYSVPIMLMVPVNILSTTFFLYILGESYNVSVYIGFILLSGLAINNSIMILENYFRIENEDMSLQEKIQSAVLGRKRAMQMTTLTTIIALFPAIFSSSEGSEFWRPMSLSVIIGMTISYVGAIHFFPHLLIWTNRIKDKKFKLSSLIPSLTIRKRL
ncbi:efflux RND transporter permease subunit [Leptospira idonii]|uniref:Efflux RND transporter permease subunit n=1 Tax=Leptospira idonii TaxID=1193500 RepID=A0A4R9M3C2_9LEPT|nr:efflux RND transporter permease subunit [Leptospira idonii]TGN19789.1 efflux RND transporter permease subunit [Leptospira idonii]